jgi:hypothetical protein
LQQVPPVEHWHPQVGKNNARWVVFVSRQKAEGFFTVSGVVNIVANRT